MRTLLDVGGGIETVDREVKGVADERNIDQVVEEMDKHKVVRSFAGDQVVWE